jgi:yersiniabactin synthetase, thiazolinyl reductase component
MAQALEVAQSHGRGFQVNAHFADLAAPQAFFRGLAEAREVGPVLQFDMSLNVRTLYSGLDLLGRAAGSLEGIDVALAFCSGPEPAPFANVWLTGAQWRASLLCQNFASAQDDGSAALLNHRCSATFGHGNLLLAESNGPVLWFPSPVSMPRAIWRTWLPIEMHALDLAGLQQLRECSQPSGSAGHGCHHPR